MLATLTLGLVFGQSALKVAPLFSDHMVLQRDMATPVYGQAMPGAVVTVSLGGVQKQATTDDTGRWFLRLPRQAAGGPHTLTIETDAQRIDIQDVLFGDVWICSGQSNMEWPVSAAQDPQKEVDEATPQVRMFTVPKFVAAERPVGLGGGQWAVAGPTTAWNFSAVGYAFAKVLRRELDVPIGMIHTSWGGTPAESWTPAATLRTDAMFAPILERYQGTLEGYEQRRAEYERAYTEWAAKAFMPDTRNEGYDRGYAQARFNDAAWTSVNVPSPWERTLGRPLDGAVWLRKTVELPESWVGRPLRLELGPIDDFDETYVNGIRVGRTGKETPSAWQVTRRYMVPPALAQRSLSIAVRVWDRSGGGGIQGEPADQRLVGPNGESLPLAGEWKLQVEREIQPPSAEVLATAPRQPNGPSNPWTPSSLYNGMIAPLVPYGIRGAIWYQGESNADRAEQYARLFPAMISSWRRAWNQGDFPFYFVQLANFMARDAEPRLDPWPELREAQRLTEALPKTGMAVAIDIGDASDIHPRNKREVGRRLALLALREEYGQSVEARGPTYNNVAFRSGAARLVFTHDDGLRTADGGPIKGFTIAGADRKWYWAQAEFDGTAIVVRSPMVSEPVAVRYAWGNNPEVNLVNRAGLPAVPFRTDDWPFTTAGKR